MSEKKLFTSESVTEGHPDKICDQIADALLDDMLRQDPMSRAAVEAVTTTGIVFVLGEVTTNGYVDIERVTRETIREIGYDKPDYGFDYSSCAVISSIKEQSADIAGGVDHALETRRSSAAERFEALGAGDQGMMFGYACTDTPELMPMPIALSHRLAKKLADARKENLLGFLRPDGKTQVTVLYENDVPVMVTDVVVSTQHSADAGLEEIEKGVIDKVVKVVIPQNLLDKSTRYHVNPSGRFVIGGPNGDSGLTGRKIIVDTYGGVCGHGGGSFSGKDATKVDRSASYMTRYIAKNLVAAGIARKCEVQVSYAIGMSHPLSVFVNTFGTGKTDDAKIIEIINRHFDLRPAAIIERLDLRKPIFKRLAAYGHFGRTDVDLAWEKTDVAEKL